MDKVIIWELGELQETLKGNWGVFVVWGKDRFGREYSGDLQTFINDPIIEDVYNIYQVT